LISLGCAKNLVDAEIMLGALLQAGLEVTNDPAQADVVIVNTCSFIDSAQKESVEAILESGALREATHRGQGLIVAGCLTQRFRDELPKLLPEVDAFMGLDQVTQAPAVVRQAMAVRAERLQNRARRSPRFAGPHPVPAASSATAPADQAKPFAGRGRSEPTPALVTVNRRPTYIPDYATPRFRLTPRHFAYVKIAEGCNHPCSFCIIPRMRGSHRSRPLADLVAEARHLLAEGVKELNLISQDSTYYGLDLRPNHSRAIAAPDRFAAAARSRPLEIPTLCTLLRELNALPGRFWVRLLYTHPAHWTDELIETMAHCRKVARYVDIPLQHIADPMLERMRRETSRAYILDLLGRIRAGIPGIALRTTFIVGFPGETERCFQELLDFIQATRFERMGVFTYSQEEGTVAGRMARQVPDQVKEQRRDRAMAAQVEVSRRVGASWVGRELTVLVERAAVGEELAQAQVRSWEHGLLRASAEPAAELGRNYMVGRGEADAPDIDGRIYIRGRLAAGDFARVRVVGHTDYDLIAEAA
jgi:ribosomal protein S12 methylthiotransferase